VLDISVSVKRIGAKSVTFSIDFHRGETRIAHGQLKTVCCHFGGGEEMKSIEVPVEYRNQLEAFKTD
jgi:acyl-CoA thioesterase FadM